MCRNQIICAGVLVKIFLDRLPESIKNTCHGLNIGWPWVYLYVLDLCRSVDKKFLSKLPESINSLVKTLAMDPI
jgi:hypothetical protein